MTGKDSIAVCNQIEQIDMNGRKLIVNNATVSVNYSNVLQTHSVKAPNEKFSVIVSNIPPEMDLQAAKDALSKVTGVASEQIVESPAVHTTVNIRLGYLPEDQQQKAHDVIREVTNQLCLFRINTCSWHTTTRALSMSSSPRFQSPLSFCTV